MKIYTLTFQNANNYGAVLQAYALQKKIKEKYETQILNYDNLFVSDNYRIIKKRYKNPLKILYTFFLQTPFLKKELVRIKSFKKFRKTLCLTRVCKNMVDVESEIDNDSVVIVGSDQVWNPIITGGIDKVYFLDFTKKPIRRISYAASCGKVEHLKDYKLEIEEKLRKFNCLSVREESLKNFLEEDCDIEASVVNDPTMLLTKEEWIENIPKKRLVKEKYIFVYSIGIGSDFFYETAQKVASLLNCHVVCFDKSRVKKLEESTKYFYDVGPEEFLNLLKNSEFVVTTSFHGFVLSTILNKKMIVVLDAAPDRIITTAKKLNLENRIINDTTQFENVFYKAIDWKKTNSILNEERKKSITWLFNAIEGEKDEQKQRFI